MIYNSLLSFFVFCFWFSVSDLASRSPLKLLLVLQPFLDHSVMFDVTGCSRFVSYPPCPSPGVSVSPRGPGPWALVPAVLAAAAAAIFAFHLAELVLLSFRKWFLIFLVSVIVPIGECV